MQIVYNNELIPVGMIRVAGKAFLKKPAIEHAEQINAKAHVGNVVEFEDGTLELCVNAYPHAGRPMTVLMKNPVPIKSTSIAAILEFADGYARFEIGEARFNEREGTLIFYGIPDFEARLIIHEGPRHVHFKDDLQH